LLVYLIGASITLFLAILLEFEFEMIVGTSLSDYIISAPSIKGNYILSSSSRAQPISAAILGLESIVSAILIAIDLFFGMLPVSP
jgi:hypothetical protein